MELIHEKQFPGMVGTGLLDWHTKIRSSFNCLFSAISEHAAHGVKF